ncbi:MAG: ABC transporter ATP-binding protein [Candidatus Bathyarchaeia archaeon]
MTSDYILQTEKVNKFFGGIQALCDLSIQVKRGEILGIIGPNGSGKSTFFKIVMGVYKPESGKVLFDGVDITNFPPFKVCRMGIAMAYQIPKPFSSLTVMENLLVAAISGGDMPKQDAEEYCLDILKLTDLYKIKDKPAGVLLPLELKRLEVGRALASKPKLLLLDEPAAGMREKEIAELLELVKMVNSQGTTIILVEHRMDVVVKAVEELVVLNRGAVLAQGGVSQILDSTVVADIYLGRRFRGRA